MFLSPAAAWLTKRVPVGPTERQPRSGVEIAALGELAVGVGCGVAAPVKRLTGRSLQPPTRPARLTHSRQPEVVFAHLVNDAEALAQNGYRPMLKAMARCAESIYHSIAM